MKKITSIFILPLLILANSCYALSEPEAEDLADLTAVFVYLKNNCGYSTLPNAQIQQAILYFAQQNRWDLSNYYQFDMQKMGEASYKDLSKIAVPPEKKCYNLAQQTLVLLNNVN
jgi:hypothetical protein